MQVSKLMFSVLSLATLVALSSCGFPDARSIAPVSESIGGVVDAGAVPLPNKPGWQLRSYNVLRKHEVIHYVYVLEQNGEPVADTSTEYKQGKTSRSVSVAVSRNDAPDEVLRCSTTQECLDKLAAKKAQEDADYKAYQALKSRFEGKTD